MHDYRKVIPILFIHIFLGLTVCCLWYFLRPLPIDMLPPLVTGYRIRSTILLFISFIPALFISSLLIGYSLEFSAIAGDSIGRWSETLFAYIKRAYILLLICLAIYVVLSEAIAPRLGARQKQDISKTTDYREFMDRAQLLDGAGKFSEAELQAHAALVAWPGNSEASYLLEQLQYKTANSAPAKEPGTAANQENGDVAIINPSGLTALEALDKALDAEKKNDFYNAHYYATLATRLAPSTDPNREIAVRLASRAWNEISAGKDRIGAKDNMELFNTKRDGYNAIQNGDYLRAYYIFLGLHEKDLKSKDGLTDPDVDRFLEISRNGVLQSFFFIDETFNMNLYESARNVFFVIRHPDGSAAAVFAKGITYTRHTGKDMAYLRDFEYVCFDRNQKIRYRISVPYAKMFPSAVGNRPHQQPELLMRSVDRRNAGVSIGPKVLEGTVPENEKSILVLDMDFRDIDSIVAADRGVETMSLPALWLFASRSEQYGFSRAAIKMESLRRLVDPFLMLIISVYALILGWKFRLDKGVLFKFWWIIVVPLFPVLSFMLMELARYLSGLCIFAIVSIFPGAPEIMVLVVLALWFTGASIHFFSQRSD